MIAIIYSLNAGLAFLVLRYEFYSHSDKSIIISSALYLGLIAINLIAGLILQLGKKHFHHFYLCGLLLMITAAVSIQLW